MKIHATLIRSIMLFLCVPLGTADTFRHKESGDVFVGFATQKVASGKTLVYNSDEGKMTPVVLDDYEIVSNSQGRRDAVFLILLNKPEIFISPTVSKMVAETIIDASNKGPQAIILQIDAPGGSGDAMKTIADAILQTNNCPVIAYVAEGAYSAAAVVAMACDRIYLKPTAAIGSVGSPVAGLSYGEYLSVYSSDFQLNDFLYATLLAQKKDRPELLIRALIDKSVSIIQVANEDSSKTFVEKKDRQQRQRLIETLCEGLSAEEMGRISSSISSSMDSSRSSESISPADFIGKVLNLTAYQALEYELIDDTAESVEDILSKMQLSDARVTPVPSIENILKKFTAGKRNISDGLWRIEQYEREIKTLSDQFTTIDNQLRTGTETREVRRGEIGYSSRRRRETSSISYGQDTVRDRRSRTIDIDRQQPHSQSVIIQEPRVNIQIVYNQLTTMLQNAVAEYRRVLNLVDRWPGGLPPRITRDMLQNDMDSASDELDRLYRYQPVYPLQDQQQLPEGRTRRNRRF